MTKKGHFLFLFVIYIHIVQPARGTDRCPEFCYCTDHTVTCKHHKRSLWYIPRIPPSTLTLDFKGNYLPNVTRHTFYNVTGPHLKELNLGGNSIVNISDDAFSGFTNLRFLDLSGNQIPIMNLQQGFRGLRKARKLSKLYLLEMALGNLPENFFNDLTNTHLEGVSLNQNNLTVLNGSIFRSLQHLKYIGVNNNKLSMVAFEGLQKISVVRLRWNRLKSIPEFCRQNDTSFTPNLKVIDLGCNQIARVNPQNFRRVCLPRLRNLTLDENYISVVPNNTFADLPNLTRLSIHWLKENYVFFESSSLNSSSVRQLYMANHLDMFPDPSTRSKVIDYRNLFRFCPNLQLLDLTKIRLTTSDGEKVRDLLLPLVNLRKLILQSTSLQIIHDDLFRHMPNLTSLNLGHSLISRWNSSAFENLHSLRTLYMDYNLITLINQSSFPAQLLDDIENINVANNPFLCDCDLVWFRQWMESNKHKLLLYPYTYICKSPPDMNGKELRLYNPSYLECNPLNPYIIVSISASGGFLLVLVIVAIVYKYRWHIKYYIYLIRARKGYERLTGVNDDFLYDVFVAYNSQDRVWVISQLIPYLENKEKLRLCLHDRDFEVGKLILDNITDKINLSRKILLVLSNSFAKSQWCKFELAMAQLRFLKEGGNVLIVVLLEDILTKNMSSSLHVLLKTTTFLEWTTEVRGHDLFWKRLCTAVHGN